MDYLKEYFRNVTTIYFGSMMGMITYLTIDDSVKVNLNMLWKWYLLCSYLHYYNIYFIQRSH